MNFCEIKEGLHIVGIEGGSLTRQVVTYLEGKGQQVALYSAQEATMAMPLLVTRSNELPLALDAGYEEQELADLFHAAMRCGMRLMPLGDTAVWEEMVPLELPELAATPVLPADSDWFDPEPAGTETSADSATADYYGIMDIAGTAVSIRMPDLTAPLADLNVAAAATPPVVQSQPIKAQKKSSSKKLSRHSAVIALLCVILATALIVICCVLIPHGPNGGYPQPEAPAQTLPSARPVRVWINDCPHCRERLTLTVRELVPILSSNKKTLFTGAVLNDMMLKVATSVNNGGMTCNKCKKLKTALNQIHGRWHMPESGKWVLDWKLARVGNATYKKIQMGAILGCYSCKESLNEALVQHCCPDDSAKSDAFKPGADLTCSHCQDMLKVKLLEEHVCPADNNPAKLKEGEDLGCKKCAQRRKHQCPEPKTRESLQAGADISCPLCRKNLEILQKHVCPGADNEKELKKGKELGCATCAHRYAKLQELKKMMKAKQETRPVPVSPRVSPSEPVAPRVPQPHSAPSEDASRVQKIDGQWCPSNDDVKGSQKIDIVRNHAQKGCPRCKKNYRWWLEQKKQH